MAQYWVSHRCNNVILRGNCALWNASSCGCSCHWITQIVNISVWQHLKEPPQKTLMVLVTFAWSSLWKLLCSHRVTGLGHSNHRNTTSLQKFAVLWQRVFLSFSSSVLPLVRWPSNSKSSSILLKLAKYSATTIKNVNVTLNYGFCTSKKTTTTSSRPMPYYVHISIVDWFL